VLLGGRRQPHAQKVRAGERALAREKSTGCGRTLVFPLLLFFPHTREAVTRRRSRELLKKLAHPGGESSAGAGGGVLLRSVPYVVASKALRPCCTPASSSALSSTKKTHKRLITFNLHLIFLGASQ